MEILSYEFIQNAIAAGILASIACGLIGPFVVSKRMVFISDGLSHTAFGGLGIAYWAGFNPLYGAIGFVLLTAVIIGLFEEKSLYRNDLLIGILWSVGMAIGIIFIYLTPGFTPDLMSFLFGNILTVPRFNIIIISVLVCLVLLFITVYFKGFVSITLDEEFSRARGLPVRALNVGLLLLVAVSIVALIQVVGIVLIIALLTIPVAIANELSIRFKTIMLISVLIGALICLGGLAVSYFVELPSGAVIILIGGGLLGAVKFLKAAAHGKLTSSAPG
ncbi:MAG: metal ABC transporter permease [Syntrophaceae bacterium]